MGEWDLTIDRQLCGLVDRLRAIGYSHTLEVVLEPTEYEYGAHPGRYDFTKSLPRFRERGVVVVIGTVHGDRVVHPSTYSR